MYCTEDQNLNIKHIHIYQYGLEKKQKLFSIPNSQRILHWNFVKMMIYEQIFEHIKIYRDKNAISNGKVGKISIMSNNSMIFKLNNKEDFPNVRK